MDRLRLRTLQSRMLLPLLATALVAALLVAVVSAYLGRKWARQVVQDRFTGIRTTLDQSAFPLTASVLRSVADLTDAELFTIGTQNQVLSETRTLSQQDRSKLLRTAESLSKDVPGFVSLNEQNYLTYAFARSGRTQQNDDVSTVVVMFDQQRIDESSRQAAMLPLLTGLSTIALLTLVMMAMTRLLVRRLVHLQQGVQRVASGDFNITVADQTSDEVGRLGAAIDSMSGQLGQLWKQVHRQESAKLLHQIASGMAHQLRNTLTGSRMAMELHRQVCPTQEQDDIDVAIRQMEVAEDYVRRLLLLGTGHLEKEIPCELKVCLQDVHTSYMPVAKHLNVTLNWNNQPIIGDPIVADGPNFSAAISNLVMNALQVATIVDVSISIQNDICTIEVSDNGPGVEPALADEIFEPFATSKPEGIGLGLALVKRVANQLGGQVTWKRENSQTVFCFECPITWKVSS